MDKIVIVMTLCLFVLNIASALISVFRRKYDLANFNLGIAILLILTLRLP